MTILKRIGMVFVRQAPRETTAETLELERRRAEAIASLRSATESIRGGGSRTLGDVERKIAEADGLMRAAFESGNGGSE